MDRDEKTSPPAEPGEETLDTDGHSFSLVTGLNRIARGDPRARRPQPDEDVKPLTKKWPSLREEKRS